MLILTRKIDQRIFINGKEIIITIIGIGRNSVKLGIQADNDMIIHREEVYNRIQAELQAKLKEEKEDEG